MMKYRKWSISVLLVVLLLLVPLQVFASELTYVYDEADLLSAEEEMRLAKTAEELSLTYDCGVYIVTMWDFGTYGSTVRGAAENYFLTHGLGLGSDDNGVLLMLSMAQRDYALIAHGSIGNESFTDYGKDVLSEAFLDDFGANDWFGGFADYLATGEEMLDAAAQGTPVDVPEGSGVGLTVAMVLVIPALIAGISCAVMASSMKTARQKTEANDYSKAVQLTNREDRFITRTVVREKIETSSSSGGGTTVNSGGFSGKSGKF